MITQAQIRDIISRLTPQEFSLWEQASLTLPPAFKPDEWEDTFRSFLATYRPDLLVRASLVGAARSEATSALREMGIPHRPSPLAGPARSEHALLDPIERLLGYYQEPDMPIPERIRELSQNFLQNEEMSREHLDGIERRLGYASPPGDLVPLRIERARAVLAASVVMSRARLAGILGATLLVGLLLGYVLGRRGARTDQTTAPPARWA